MRNDPEVTGFASIANHKFLWYGKNQSSRKGEPKNFQIFIRIGAPMTIEELVAVRDLLRLFHSRDHGIPLVKYGKTLFGRQEELEERRISGPPLSWPDNEADQVTFYCGRPPVANFPTMDVIMAGLVNIGLTCSANIEIGKGDYDFYAVWRPGRAASQFFNQGEGAAAFSQMGSPRPFTEEQRGASIARTQQIAELAQDIEKFHYPVSTSSS